MQLLLYRVSICSTLDRLDPEILNSILSLEQTISRVATHIHFTQHASHMITRMFSRRPCALGRYLYSGAH